MNQIRLKKKANLLNYFKKINIKIKKSVKNKVRIENK